MALWAWPQSLSAESASSSAGDPSATARQVERPGRTGLPIPRFVSLRSDEVNLRRGPGMRYPVDWVFQRRDLPVEVIDEFEIWRQVRDSEGTTGWLHQGMIKGDRYLMIVGQNRSLRSGPQEDARPIAQLEPGVLGRLVRCQQAWCAITVADYEGWIKRSEAFGVYPEEAP